MPFAWQSRISKTSLRWLQPFEAGKDPSPKVRFQLLCTLGFIDTPASRLAQNQLLLAAWKMSGCRLRL